MTNHLVKATLEIAKKQQQLIIIQAKRNTKKKKMIKGYLSCLIKMVLCKAFLLVTLSEQFQHLVVLLKRVSTCFLDVYFNFDGSGWSFFEPRISVFTDRKATLHVTLVEPQRVSSKFVFSYQIYRETPDKLCHLRR